jgi:hypothetical protein
MAVTVPVGFPVVGSNNEGGQVAQYLPGRPIGGGVLDPEDGQDEATDSLQGITHTWARGRLSLVNCVELYGAVSPQASIAERTAAGWSGYVLWMPCNLGTDRTDLTATVDYEDGQVEITAYNAATDVLVATATTAVTVIQTQASLTLAGLPQTSYLKVRIQTTGAEVKLYGIRAYEDPSTP